MEVQQRLSNWPLLRLLWHDPLFRWALLGCLGVGFLVVLAILPIWVVTPPGMVPQIRIKALDFFEARLHGKLAQRKDAARDFDGAQYHWRVAVQNNPAKPELLHGFLANLVAQPPRSPARSRTALEQSFWLLRLRGTNQADLRVILPAMEHFRFDELALIWATNAPAPGRTEFQPVALRALLRLGQGEKYAALRATVTNPPAAADHLPLFDAAWRLGWGGAPDDRAARELLQAAETNAATAVTALELQLLLAGRQQAVVAHGNALERLRDLHADTPSQHSAHWNLLRAHDRVAEATRLALDFADPPVSSAEIVRVSTAFIGLGLTNHATQFLEHFVPQLGATPECWTILGDVLLAQRRWSDLRGLAVEIRRNPLASGSLAGFSHFLDGAAAMGELAEIDAQAAFARVPRNPIHDDHVAYNVAQALLFYRAYAPARDVLLSRTQRFNGSPEFWQTLVRVAYQLRDSELLLRAARTASELAPDRLDTLTDLAAALLVERNRPEEALALTRRLVQAKPQSVSARMNYALALLQNQQATAARAILLTFEPDRLGALERSVWQFARAQMLALDGDPAGTLAAVSAVEMKSLFPKQISLLNELRARAEVTLGLPPATPEAEPPPAGK
jgi:predicted Zn-dependent protease